VADAAVTEPLSIQISVFTPQASPFSRETGWFFVDVIASEYSQCFVFTFGPGASRTDRADLEADGIQAGLLMAPVAHAGCAAAAWAAICSLLDRLSPAHVFIAFGDHVADGTQARELVEWARWVGDSGHTHALRFDRAWCRESVDWFTQHMAPCAGWDITIGVASEGSGSNEASIVLTFSAPQAAREMRIQFPAPGNLLGRAPTRVRDLAMDEITTASWDEAWFITCELVRDFEPGCIKFACLES
jgi:hypothetical protein